MIKIMFVCHGNICRSPMAEALFRHMIREEGLSDRVFIDSSATSYEEIGNPVHPGTRNKLKRSDLDEYDYIFTMDQNNMNNIKREFGSIDQSKVMKFMDLTDHPRDISDPWYTGNFDQTYDDIYESCLCLMKLVKERLGA